MISDLLSNMSDYSTSVVLRIQDLINLWVEQLVEKTGLSEQKVHVALTLAGLTSGWLLWRLLAPGKKYKLPPGPRPLPLVGNMWGFGHVAKRLEQLNQKYGPMYQFSLGPQRTIVLSSADLIREALIKNSLNFAEKTKATTGELLTKGKDIIMCSEYSDRLKIQRKLAFSALRNYASGAALDNHVNHAFGEMCKEIEKHPEGVEAMEIAYLVSFNMLASMAVGKKFEIDDPLLQKIMGWSKRVEEDFRNMGILGFVLILNRHFRHLPLKLFKTIADIGNLWKGFLGENLKEHIEKYSPENLNDFTDFIIHEMKEAEKDPNERNKLKLLDEEHFVFVLFDLFLAGTETTRQTLAWFWYYMAAFPGVQKKAQEEIDTVLGREGSVTTNSRENLHYVDCVLHEVLRIKPVAPVTLRVCKEDITIGGFDIPKGHTVMVNAYSVHFNEKEWKDPYAFLPERWLDPQTGKYLFQDSGFMPFAVGRRSCIGESFAKLELHMLLTLMLQKYTVKARPGYQISIDSLDKFAFRPPRQTIVFEKR